MRGYKIIQDNGKWFFLLIPNNSNSQEIGCSKSFQSYVECEEGVQKFRKLIIENRVNSYDSPFVSIIECGREAFLEYSVNGEMIFQSRKYSSSSPRTCCKKCVVSIHKHIDEYTLKQV